MHFFLASSMFDGSIWLATPESLWNTPNGVGKMHVWKTNCPTCFNFRVSASKLSDAHTWTAVVVGTVWMTVVAVLVWGSRHWKLNYECHVKRVCELCSSQTVTARWGWGRWLLLELWWMVIGLGAEGQCAWKLLIKPRNVAGQTLTERSGHLMHFDR